MRLRFPKALAVLVVVLAAVPTIAAASSEVILPVAGYLDLPDDVTYRTEMTITNNRDTFQYVHLSLIRDGFEADVATIPFQAHETIFFPTAGFPTSTNMQSYVGALRIRALTSAEGGPDSAAQIQATAFVIREVGLGRFGTSRQEVNGIPSSEYNAAEGVFLGVRHSLGTGMYTNVGITNLDGSETVTFAVQFQYLDPIMVTVPPKSQRAIRIPGEGNGGRYVRITPEWAMGGGTPTHTTPWVAYTSSIDTTTGDAFSGIRVPASSWYRH